MCQITSVDIILPMWQLVKDRYKKKNMSLRKSAHHQKNHPSHHNIIMYILLTVLHSMPKVLTGRIYLKIKSFFSW